MNTLIPVLVAVALLAASSLATAQVSESNEIKDIKELLTDTAAGHVSASSALGIANDAVAVVENPRSLVAAVKGLGTSGSQVALAVTPARTSFSPMSLSTYKEGGTWARLLGNATLSYAQGTSKVEKVEMQRRAASVETSITLKASQDPLIAVANACKWTPPVTQPGQPAKLDDANTKYIGCVNETQAALAKKWNVSRFSISVAGGTIKPEGGASISSGQTAAASLIYGFDHIGAKLLQEGAAVTVTLRHSRNEPVLAELAKGTVQRKNSSLAAVRLSGGTASVRALIEISNARTRDATATQDVFRQAAGVDAKVADGTWLNFRVGRQRKDAGEGIETKTLLNFSFSPKANLL